MIGRLAPPKPSSQSFSLAKDGRSDANAGRAFFDGGLEVVRHAHGEGIEIHGREAARETIAEIAQLAKVWPRAFRVIGERRNGHKAAELEVRPVFGLLQNRVDFW